jgi:LmbE family N-acetylglucosaminyl deacetylase
MFERVLAIGPHPDDIEMGCGGAVARCVADGGAAHLVVVTGGEAGPTLDDLPTFAAQRVAEQQLAAERLGASHVFLNHPDLEVQANGSLIDALDLHVRSFAPQVVFAPWPHDTHQDHRAVSLAAMAAARNGTQLLFYATPTSIGFEPTVFCDVEAVMDQKMAALFAHVSQVTGSARVDPDVIRAMARVLGPRAGCTYAEGFVAYRLRLDTPADIDHGAAIASRLTVSNHLPS